MFSEPSSRPTTIESGQNANRESISVIVSSHCADLPESKEDEAGWLKMVVGIVNRKGILWFAAFEMYSG